MEKNELKQRAKRLKTAIFSVLNMDCTQSQAYEIMAKEENFPNWDALSGSLEKTNTVLSAKEQIAQLFFIAHGLREGFAFSHIVELLANQSNQMAKKAWAGVSKDKNIYEVFSQTKLFNDSVITIFKMYHHNLEASVKAAIELLKLDI